MKLVTMVKIQTGDIEVLVELSADVGPSWAAQDAARTRLQIVARKIQEALEDKDY